MRELIFEGRRALRWRDVREPTVQGDRQAVVRPIATAACDLDHRIIAGATAFEPPFAIGHECVAEVVEIGDSVREVRVGDTVVVPWKPSCGECPCCVRGLTASCPEYGFLGAYGLPLGTELGGLFSDRVLVPFADAMLVGVPTGVNPIDVAAAGDNLTDAFIGVDKGLTKNPGAPVLIWGGTGSLGLYAVQIALALGAQSVDYVDDSDERRSIAADSGAAVHDDFRDDFTMKFPVVVCATRQPANLRTLFLALAPGGHLASLSIFFTDQPIPLWEMYVRDVSFSTGKSSTRPFIPRVLELCAVNRLHPGTITTNIIPWDDAPEGLLQPAVKSVVVRDAIGAAL